MRVFTPIEVAERSGSKYLGVLVAARYARELNALPKDAVPAGLDIQVADLGGGLGIPHNPALADPPSPEDYGAMVRRIGPVEVSTLPGREEHMEFRLPAELTDGFATRTVSRATRACRPFVATACAPDAARTDTSTGSPR